MKTLHEAIVGLVELGLVAEVVDGDSPYILGGTSVTNDLGFNVYQNSFNIVLGHDGWEVTVTGPGQLDTVERTQTLADSVLAVHRILMQKQMFKCDRPIL